MQKKQIACILFSLCVFMMSACNKDKYDVAAHLNQDQQKVIKMELARYMEKLPPRITMEKRWDSAADRYYQLKADSMHLLKYYKADDGYEYFFVTRIVPSVRVGERRASVGRFKRSKSDFVKDVVRFDELEEFCLTNIMEEQALVNSSDALFEEVVKNKKIADNSVNHQLIEWPNAYFAYDKKSFGWERIELIENN